MTHGELTIFCSYAMGAGKTYRMLQQAQELHKQNADIVIGYLACRHRPETMQMATGMPQLPGCMRYLDMAEILAKTPQYAVIDEMLLPNMMTGNLNFQDIEVLLEAGISVFTTLSLFRVAGIAEQCEPIAGLSINPTVPDEMVRQAKAIYYIDADPELIRDRCGRRGFLAFENKLTAKYIDLVNLKLFRRKSLQFLQSMENVHYE